MVLGVYPGSVDKLDVINRYFGLLGVVLAYPVGYSQGNLLRSGKEQLTF